MPIVDRMNVLSGGRPNPIGSHSKLTPHVQTCGQRGMRSLDSLPERKET
jgi:hypothetical protein